MSEQMQFETQAWADEFAKCLNNNPNYEKSAKTWEGALVLVFKAEGKKITKDVKLWLDLWHGKCRSAKFLKDGDDTPHEFAITAPESAWHGLVTGEIDPTRAMMTGRFKIEGAMNKLMRYPLAAGYILKYLKRLLKDW
ncbi:MAG: SCP2 sterol-binding domain-containing protein [Candidatus Sigynarchaeota archaeon]